MFNAVRAGMLVINVYASLSKRGRIAGHVYRLRLAVLSACVTNVNKNLFTGEPYKFKL
jgi:hypothetical protein